MGILDFLRKKKVDDQATQRARLLLAGRITEGKIVDITTGADGTVTHIFYRYHAGGVDYESSQALDAEQQGRLASYTLGATITVRFDPRQAGNSTVA